MISNRQNGRRRGRGGPRPQGMEGRPSGGANNRPETRARGNAPQLHEKYKAMARDAQMAGDRVQTEYYLQFADHYYRILNENRPRFDENRPNRDSGNQDQGQSYSADDDYEDEGGESGDDEQAVNGRDDADANADDGRGQVRSRDNVYEREQRPQRDSRPQRDGQQQRDNSAQREAQPQREARPDRDDRPQRTQPPRNAETNGDGRPERPRRDARPDRYEQTERTGQPERAEPPALAASSDADAANPEPGRAERPRRVRPAVNGADSPQADAGHSQDDAPGIDLDRLPPAISRPDVDAAGEGEDDAPRPVRRPRRPREAPPVEV